MIKKRKLRLIIFKKAFMSKNYNNIIKINTKILGVVDNIQLKLKIYLIDVNLILQNDG